MLTILIPAAGASTRMRGTDKLLQPVSGLPLLRRQAVEALATGQPVLVTLRPNDHAREAVLRDLRVPILTVPDAATGMSASLRAAARQVTGPLMVFPADMPELDRTDLARLIVSFDQAPNRLHRGASADGQPGHPVVIPAALLPELQHLTGDAGARSLLAQHGAQLVPLPANHALTDLDTLEDWKAWRAKTP